MSVNAFTVIFFTVIVTGLTDKLKPIDNIIIAGFFYLIGFGAMVFYKSFYPFLISTIL